ncbi:MAG: hypothetical protein ABI614_06215 [Planctomycetota bacterium]
MGLEVEYDSAMTLWATTSEDPHDWDEIAAYWSRYRSPATCDFVDALPIAPCNRPAALNVISQSDDWLVLDFVGKRVFTGRGIQPLGREATLAMVTDEKGNQHCPLPFRLPPWWELHEQVDANCVDQARQSPICVPRTNRDLLFGAAMIEDLAARILDVAQRDRLPRAAEDRETSNARYALTIEVHRDWLMTPREDLEGRKPRDLLHGAHAWSDAIISGQRMRFEDGAPMIAAPDDVVGYAEAPMGREEMIIYFDLCREVIEAGWFWCDRELNSAGSAPHPPNLELIGRLGELLADVRDSWLRQPFEGGAPPSFIIECSRRRVPRGASVPIFGMNDRESEQHLPDCDCPICDMMQSGMFGVGFTSLDGHHLDLDDEFAFSTHELHEDWEREQREFKQQSAEFNRKWAEREAKIAAGEIVEDEFASAWSNPMAEGTIPGDPLGHLKLSFRLAEIIGDLECASAPNEIIKDLNVSFREYRESDPDQREAAKQLLCRHLETTGERFPDLLSKVVDFQAQVDELERGIEFSTNLDDDIDSDFPF